MPKFVANSLGGDDSPVRTPGIPAEEDYRNPDTPKTDEVCRGQLFTEINPDTELNGWSHKLHHSNGRQIQTSCSKREEQQRHDRDRAGEQQYCRQREFAGASPFAISHPRYSAAKGSNTMVSTNSPGMPPMTTFFRMTP
jgi:hypothetical protein